MNLHKHPCAFYIILEAAISYVLIQWPKRFICCVLPPFANATAYQIVECFINTKLAR